MDELNRFFVLRGWNARFIEGRFEGDKTVEWCLHHLPSYAWQEAGDVEFLPYYRRVKKHVEQVLREHILPEQGLVLLAFWGYKDYEKFLDAVGKYVALPMADRTRLTKWVSNFAEELDHIEDLRALDLFA